MNKEELIRLEILKLFIINGDELNGYVNDIYEENAEHLNHTFEEFRTELFVLRDNNFISTERAITTKSFVFDSNYFKLSDTGRKHLVKLEKKLSKSRRKAFFNALLMWLPITISIGSLAVAIISMQGYDKEELKKEIIKELEYKKHQMEVRYPKT